MQMQMMMNMTCRAELLMELGLASDLFESALVRTEELLKKRRYQRGLRLVHGACATMEERGEEYRGVIDFLVALSSPQWKDIIQDYYVNESGRLIQTYDWETIEQMDHAICALLHGLEGLFRNREELEWAGEDVDDGFWDDTIAALIRNQMMDLMPAPQIQVAIAA